MNKQRKVLELKRCSMIDIANVINRGLEFCHCDLFTDLNDKFYS